MQYYSSIGNLFSYIYVHFQILNVIINNYNVAFVNSERWLAKRPVDIIQCQHGNVGKFL
jgi:hypothetical protein